MGHVPGTAYDVFNLNLEPNLELLKSILKEVSSQFDRVYIMIDALDESQPRGNLLCLLEDLIEHDAFQCIQLFATSREYFDIQSTMRCISEPLSLSNKWVEADINRLISSKTKYFQGWPSDLRQEVEQKLSLGARGMFRWAVCQLDILRRLPQFEVRNAINNFPRDLDATYERIFSLIHHAQHHLVRHVLQWIDFYSHLFQDQYAPTSHILRAFPRSMNETEYPVFTDIETIKDACGCLVIFKGVSGGSVAFAHYTVREFLASHRTSMMPVSSLFGFQHYEHRKEIQTRICEHVLAMRQTGHDTKSIEIATNYMIIIMALFQKGEGFPLSFLARFFDPRLGMLPNASGFDTFLQQGLLDHTRGWHGIVWSTFSANKRITAIILQLQSMSCLRLAGSVMQQINARELLESRLSFDYYNETESKQWNRRFKFDGTFLECMVRTDFRQLPISSTYPLQRWIQMCIENRAGVDFSSGLAFFAGSLFHRSKSEKSLSILKELLRVGALPEPPGYKVTPLQIMCAVADIEGAHVLLEAGADPNATGDETGVAFGEDDPRHVFSGLHGASPVCIVHEGSRHSGGVEELEKLLHQYDAEDFTSKYIHIGNTAYHEVKLNTC